MVQVPPLRLPLPAKAGVPMSRFAPSTGAVEVRLKETVCVNEPLVPVTVKVYVPIVMALEVFTVSTDGAPDATVEGLNHAEAPDGSPAIVRVTLPVAPFNEVVFSVYVVPKPALAVCMIGVAPSVKSGGDGAVTTSVTGAVLVIPPPVAVMLSV
jgi:hypothetical protein